MRKTTLSSMLPLALAAVFVGAPIASTGAPAAPCPAPVLADLPGYFAPGETTIAWTAGDAGGFIAQVSEDGLTNADGSFVNVLAGEGNIPASQTSFTFATLTADARYFFNVRAKNKPGGCHASAWSNVESTIIDATGPSVTIEHPEDEGVVVSVTGLTVSGTAIDPMIGSMPGSGPASVTIALTNTTPAVGELLGSPDAVTVATEGEAFTHTFSGLVAGTYTVSVSATDAVGNTGEAATADFVVVSVG